MKLFITVLFLSIFFSGCFGTFYGVAQAVPKHGSDISIDEKLTRNNNDVILNDYDYEEISGIRITDDFSDSNLLGSIDIPSGEFLKKYIDSQTEAQYYCGKYFQPKTGSKSNYKFCLVGEFGDLDSHVIVYNKNKTYGPNTLNDILSYETVEIMDISKPARKVELIFSGVKDNKILFTYNEYSESLDQPSFTSQIKYKLNKNKPTMIAYKSAKIKIYKANNQEIVYKVLKSFLTHNEQQLDTQDFDEYNNKDDNFDDEIDFH